MEFASVLAGPAVGMFLAELGAEVVKIENPATGGDTTRHWKLPDEDASTKVSAYYAAANYGKQHLFLDLKNSDDLKQASNLALSADIILTNFKSGGAEKFGLDFISLQKINPRLIYAALKGFDSAPNRVAYDLVIQAECGFMGMNGTDDSGPIKLPLAFIDILAAHHLKEGILAALYQRSTTGKGQEVLCSLETCALANLANQASNYLTTGNVPQRIGSLHPNIAPYGEVFTCKDGKDIVLAVGTDKQFKRLVELLNVAKIGDDSRFATNGKRVLYRDELYPLLQNAFTLVNRETILELFIAQDVPCGAVKMMDEVFNNPVAREMVLEDIQDGQVLRRVATVGFVFGQE